MLQAFQLNLVIRLIKLKGLTSMASRLSYEMWRNPSLVIRCQDLLRQMVSLLVTMNLDRKEPTILKSAINLSSFFMKEVAWLLAFAVFH